MLSKSLFFVFIYIEGVLPTAVLLRLPCKKYLPKEAFL